MASAMIDIGNTFTKVAIFDQDKLFKVLRFQAEDLSKSMNSWLQDTSIKNAFISSVNNKSQTLIEEALNKAQIPFSRLDKSSLKLKHVVEDFDAMGDDRLCNLIGALHFFPAHDCLVIDIGTAITFDLITKDGTYQGGAIFAGSNLIAQALHMGTSLLPKVEKEIQVEALGKTTQSQIQSGIYFGLLGAIERISFELCQSTPSASSVKVIATGGVTIDSSLPFFKDLAELTNFIAPNLTVEGLYNIYKEQIHNLKEKTL